MANRKKNLNVRQKRNRGMEKPAGRSKYAKKKVRQARGIFSHTSPFRAV